MYNDFSIAISSTENILRIKSEFNFIEHIKLTSTLSGIPFTNSFLHSYSTVVQKRPPIIELAETIYDDFFFLLDYSDIPIILYKMYQHHDLGPKGGGDEAWLFTHGNLSAHYIEDEVTEIGDALDKVLAESKLDLGKLPRELNRGYMQDDPILFRTLRFKHKRIAEDFLK